ncbi:MAG: hypothetical protein WAL71_08520 [Terriglobales bacterium]|jgi:hypothetical protein
MLRISSRAFHPAIGTIALFLLTSAVAFSQATQSQSPSSRAASGQASSQSSSAQTWPSQSPPNQLPSGQSLGEIARKNQQKRAAHASTAPPPKVITNSDLPKNPDGYTTATANPRQNSSTSLANAAASRRAASQRTAEQRAAVQWRQQILVQENKVANLQARFDRLRAQIHLVNPNANYSSGEGIAYNPGQARQIVRLQEMQDQLNQQKQKLDQMQEAARHAGMHTTVYDP